MLARRWILFLRIGGLALLLSALLAPISANADILTFSGALTAKQVVAGGGSTSTATGFATVNIDTNLFTITTDLSWSGLTGIADRAHLHDAPPGETIDPPNGDFFHEVLSDGARTIPCNWPDAVFVDCVPTTGTSHDVLQLSGPDDGYGYPTFADLVSVFQKGGIYLDMHTEMYPAGEIRGQLAPAVPEPASMILLATGFAGIAGKVRRRMQK